MTAPGWLCAAGEVGHAVALRHACPPSQTPARSPVAWAHGWQQRRAARLLSGSQPRPSRPQSAPSDGHAGGARASELGRAGFGAVPEGATGLGERLALIKTPFSAEGSHERLRVLVQAWGVSGRNAKRGFTRDLGLGHGPVPGAGSDRCAPPCQARPSVLGRGGRRSGPPRPSSR